MTGASDWTGSVGDVWAAEWRRTDRSLADLSRHLDAAILAAAHVGPFRALDIGCGAGGTSLALARARADATILSVDLSAALIEVARARFNDAIVLRRRPEPWPSSASRSPALRPAPEHDVEDPEVTFTMGDAVAVATTARPFDLLYSRHGVMFFDNPVAAFTALHAAAAPGARLVFSCFADWRDNGFARTVAEALNLPSPMPSAAGPFAFADRDYVADILIKAGWTVQSVARTPFTYRAGEGAGDAAISDALSFFQRIGPAAGPLRTAAPADRAVMLDRLATVIRDHRIGDAIDFPASAWIWSATA